MWRQSTPLQVLVQGNNLFQVHFKISYICIYGKTKLCSAIIGVFLDPIILKNCINQMKNEENEGYAAIDLRHCTILFSLFRSEVKLSIFGMCVLSSLFTNLLCSIYFLVHTSNDYFLYIFISHIVHVHYVLILFVSRY
jgi:hypothetical protein